MHAETRPMTYREVAAAFNLTLGSTRNLVRKRCWERTPANDGTVRIHVPLDALPAPRPAHVPTQVHAQAGAGAPADDSTYATTSAALAVLAKHVEGLQAELEP